MSYQPLDPTNYKEKVAIVTGGNTGIGYEVAKFMARNDFRVIIACRSEQRAQQALSNMKKETEEEMRFKSCTLKVEFMPLDLSSLRSTMAFVDAFKQRTLPLHVLVCNAGIVLAPYGVTEDNFEQHFQVNYLSHLLMTLHLLPIMLSTSGDDVRIVLVSSLIHVNGSFNLDNIQGNRSYNRRKFYANSKLYQVMQALSMGRHLAETKVTISSAHPGLVKTETGRNFEDSKLYSLFYSALNKSGISLSSEQGAANILEPIMNPARKGENGLYYESKKPKNPSRTARNERHQEALWKYSLECLKGYIDNDLLISAGVMSSNEQGAATDYMY